MKNPSRFTMFAGIIGFMFASLSVPVQADDTEIYTGTNAVSEVRPNIVFVIDNSGSMKTLVDNSSGTYDPDINYPGVCDPNKIYWRSKYQDSAPDCDTDQWFWATANKCKASANALDVGGQYPSNRFGMWNANTYDSSKAWVSFSTSWHDAPHYVECKNDYGKHGDGVDTTKLWPANRATGPWTSTNTNRVDWTKSGSDYTLYTGNFLNWMWGPVGEKQSRMDVVKAVFSMLMDTTDNINVAVVVFNPDQGGYVRTPMLPLDDTIRPELGNKTSRTYFKETVNALSPETWTPLAETMYEVGQFYRGVSPYFGTTTYGPGSVAASKDADGTYKTPMEYQCQKNFVVFLTDGAPTEDNSADTRIKALPNFNNLADHSCSGPPDGTSAGYDDCLDEMSEWMYKNDLNASFNGVQNVITYTIGAAPEGDLDVTLLRNAATKGGGSFYHADSTAKLVDAFTSIITEILAVNTTFAAPAVTVNAFNRLTHRKELYFALFRPAASARWPGNIKRYQLGGSPLVVQDANGNPAVDPNTGFFKVGAESWWNEGLADGEDIAVGGAASKLALPRKVYSNVKGPVLTQLDNAINESRCSDTDWTSRLGAVTDCASLLKWARGVDVMDEDTDGSTEDARLQMGDPLHTEPVLVTYGENNIVLFGSTNEGYVHAINTELGTEYFAFMPKELLPNLNTLYENDAGELHRYGMDGPLALWVNDINTDGTIAGSDHVYLYASMRRGGRNIYALNVTDLANPTVKWVIYGGSGPYTELGQTWSRPVVAKMKISGTEKRVLIFGGGYDPVHDGTSVVTASAMGRAVYVVDAENGGLIWMAGRPGIGANLELAQMTAAIPSEIRVIDVDGNGYADRMYVGDMNGRVWRFDVGASGMFETGGVVAELGMTATENTAEHARRFYYPPDISLSQSGTYLNVAIGSGFRAHPLDTTIHDRFYVLQDPVGSTTYGAWKTTDLYDYRSPLTTCGTKHGFYLDLKSESTGAWEGEKVLAESLTLNYEVNFTTFIPGGSSSSACAPGQGVGTLYRVRLPEPSSCATVDVDDIRKIPLEQPTIPPAPKAVCVTEGCTTVIGPKTVENAALNRNPVRDYWRRN